MKQSFAQEAAELDLGKVAEMNDTPATTQTTDLTIRSSMELGQVTGEFGIGDIRIPRLETAYGVGKFVERGVPQGSLVLGGDNVLVGLNTPLTITLLSATVYWKEYINADAWAAGIKPRVFASGKEVLANGGTVAWGSLNPATGKNYPPTFSKAMDMRILIRKPEGIECGLFGLDLDNGLWAPAIWTVDKTGYKRVGTTIVTSWNFTLKAAGGLDYGIFEVKNIIERVNGKPTVIPNIRYIGTNSRGTVHKIRDVFGEGGVGGDEAAITTAQPQ